MEDYRLEQTGQEVQDVLNGAAMQSDVNTSLETLQGNINAEEARAKAAEKQNADDIDAIVAKIPSSASSENKLTTKEYVDDSVASATANFRGTYNLVSDLHLQITASHNEIANALRNAIANAFKNDYAFVQVPTSAETPTEIAKIERYKFDGNGWLFEYELNNSGFTSDQWDAINSGINNGLVQKLLSLPTNEALITLLNGKQDTLIFDSAPTQNSQNSLTSGVVYTSIHNEEEARKESDHTMEVTIRAILALIPSEATASNQLADKEFVNSSIATNTGTFRGTYNLVSDLHLQINATHNDIANALGIAISSCDNNDYAFVQIPTSVDTPTEIARIERYKYNGTVWLFEYVLNNSGFTAQQWAAINSGITQQGITTMNNRISTNEDDIAMLQAAYRALTQSDIVIVTGALPASGQLNIIYRQPDQNNTPPLSYSDYMWNGTTWVLMATYDMDVNSLVGYYECDTAGATAAKTVTASGYMLPVTGGAMKIKMANRNTAANATLNINSTGAKPLFYNGVRAGVGNTWDTNETVVVYYDGTNYQAYNVKGSNGDGVFDISTYNLTNGQPTPYVDLAAALGTNGANVPQSLRKGGMSVKFIKGSAQSSDNNYVQFRFLLSTYTDARFANPENWQGVDTKPSPTKNLVESGGVYNELRTIPCIKDDDDPQSELNIGDKDGYAVLQVKLGYPKTKRFDSQIASVTKDDNSNNDLNIGDNHGNVVLRIKGGYSKTKKFDSQLASVTFNDSSDNELNIGDKYGNAVLSVRKGYTKTKNFDSQLASLTVQDDSSAELNIGDKYGDAIIQVKNGHIKTKNFNSEEILSGIISFLYSINNTPLLAHDYSQSINIDTDVNTVITDSKVTMDDGTPVVYPSPSGYPAFWIRDYAMALDSGNPFTAQDILDCYNLIKDTIPTSGSKAYWVPDHILKDGQPVWKAGTYNPDPSTDGYGSRASLDGIGFLVKIADKYIQLTNDTQFMEDELPFLLAATKSIMQDNLVYVPLNEQAVVFGFEDLIQLNGYVAYASMQAYESMIILKNWAEKTGITFNEDVNAIKKAFNEKFVRDNGYKMFRLNGIHYADTAYVAPSTNRDKDRFDVWQTAYAIRIGILNDENIIRCASALLYYKDSYIRNGMAKHVPDEFYYSSTSMWESYSGKGSYQYGGYWSTPMADIINAIKILSRTTAEEILKDAVDYGHNLNWPECVNEDYSLQNTEYVSSVTYVYCATQL